jgi:quinol monooxygenase YgiN
VLIVTGSIHARADAIDRVLEISLEHVRRSRTEPGCLLHTVHQDVEDPLRVVFVEHWADAEALRRHFAVPASNEFVKEASALADQPAELAIYTAERTRLDRA